MMLAELAVATVFELRGLLLVTLSETAARSANSEPIGAHRRG
jgi:hypothetical protein